MKNTPNGSIRSDNPMTMNGRIFTAYHFIPEPGTYRADDLYSPVVMENPGDHLPSPWTGEVPPDDRRFDAVGSLKWHVWKNLASQYDWVGFQQYRRTIDFGRRSNDEIRALVEQFDIITHTPGGWDGMENMRKNYKAHHIPEHWDAFERVMGPGWDFEATLIPHDGIGTMRTDLFMPYMTQWNEVVAELSKVITVPAADRYQRRAFGFLAERFFSLYFYRLLRDKPNTKTLFLPIIVGEQAR
jgi:hypothetical protein